MTLSKAKSTLPPELEALAEKTIGMCLKVHTAFGPGMNERVYVRACQVLVEGQLILEAKSVERINRVHVAQAVSYLRATGLRLALVINFNVESLRLQGIRRVVL